MELTELTNRFNNTSILDNLSSVKDHVKEYFLLGDTENGLTELKLDIIGEETLSADCDVTDHYVESNVARQDHIALKPKVYTIQGEVGELVWYQKDQSSQFLGQVSQRLEGVISFLPVSSRGFTQFKNKAMKALQWVDTASNALSKVSNLSSKIFGDNNEFSRSVTNQEQAYQYLVYFRDNRQLLTIKTPWGVLKNYVIMNLQFTQPKESRDKSYVSLTLKEFRPTRLGIVEFDMNKYQGNAAFENQPKVDNGKTDGEDNSLPTLVEEKPIKKYITHVETENGMSYKMEWEPVSDDLNIFSPNGVEIVENDPRYYEILAEAHTKVYNNIETGAWKQNEY